MQLLTHALIRKSMGRDYGELEEQNNSMTSNILFRTEIYPLQQMAFASMWMNIPYNVWYVFCWASIAFWRFAFYLVFVVIPVDFRYRLLYMPCISRVKHVWFQISWWQFPLSPEAITNVFPWLRQFPISTHYSGNVILPSEPHFMFLNSYCIDQKVF